MRKVKTFFSDLQKGLLPQPPFYHRVIRQPFFSSVNYFLHLVLLISIIALVRFIIVVNPPVIQAAFTSAADTLQKFPRSLNFQVQKGNLATNQIQPYFFWVNNSQPFLFAVIDENAAPAKIHEYQSTLLLTKNELVYRPQENKQLVIPAKYIPNFVLNSTTAELWRQKLTSYSHMITIWYIPWIITIFLLTVVGAFFSSLLYIVVAAIINYLLFVFIIQNKMGHRTTHLRLKHVLSIAFFASSLPLILDYMISIPPPLFLLLLSFFVFGGVYEGYLESNFTN